MANSFTNRVGAALRAFKTGPALDAFGFGGDAAAYSPAEYGTYLASSNNVYAVVTQRAEMLASLPLKLYSTNSVGERTKLMQGDLSELLHKVNPMWTFHRLIAMTEMTLCLWGVNFWFAERGPSGRQPPQELWWGSPTRVSVIPHPTEYVNGFLYMAPNGQRIPFSTGEVIWMPKENPLDEFSGLSPLGAARLAADVASAAMKSNRALFTNGLQMGGLLTPAKDKTLTPDQAKELELMLDRRFKGVDKAHRWGVLRFDAQIQNLGVTPKDAEFMGALNWSLEEICRAYHWPIDLVGGQRTYENVNAAHKAAWTHCLLPEATFIASEMNEKLLPMFGSGLECEFDSSDIEVLHEDETAKWQRSYQQIQVGAITVNEWRADQGKEPVSWGDAPKGPAAPAMPEPEIEPARARMRGVDGWEYGGVRHRLAMTRFDHRTVGPEKKLSRAVIGVFKSQEESLLAKNEQGGLSHENPFDVKEWVKRTREKVKPVIVEIVQGEAEDVLAGLGILLAFDIDNPLVKRFIEGRAQRFAEQVTATTWEQLKETLIEGVEAGDGIPEFAERVKGVMGDRIRSTPETIARTEIIGALNGGTQEAWRQSDVVSGKTWLSSLDDRTRTPDNGDEFDHVAAHGETVGLEDDFQNTGEPLEFPGADGGSAANVINCRCSMKAEIKEGWD